MARTILETLRVVTDDAADVDAVLNVMNKLADDVGKTTFYSFEHLLGREAAAASFKGLRVPKMRS